jgi:hypothetical protein
LAIDPFATGAAQPLAHVPEKQSSERLEELDPYLATRDGPIFDTVAKLVEAPA